MRIFLVGLFKRSKLLFVLAVVFIAGQGFFTWKGVENTPFFLFGMYSNPYPSKEVFSMIEITVDGEPIAYTKLRDKHREMLVGPCERYADVRNGDTLSTVVDARLKPYLSADQLKQSHENLTNSLEKKWAFKRWLTRYLRETHDPAIDCCVTLKRKRFRIETDSAILVNEIEL
jgi:hypothetical protein